MCNMFLGQKDKPTRGHHSYFTKTIPLYGAGGFHSIRRKMKNVSMIYLWQSLWKTVYITSHESEMDKASADWLGHGAPPIHMSLLADVLTLN